MPRRRSIRRWSHGGREWYRQRKEARDAKEAPPSLAKLPAPWRVVRLATRLADKSWGHAATTWLLTRPQAWMQTSLVVRFAVCIVAVAISLIPFTPHQSKNVVIGDEEFKVAREIVLQAAETCPRTIGLAAAVKILNDRGISLRLLNLSRCELPGAILPAVDLEGSNLVKINLSEANLEYGKMRFVHAQRAWFVRANLQSADLSQASLFGANFSSANMTEVRLSKSRGFLVNLSRSTLDFANLEDAQLMHANLSHASLVGAHLTATDLRYSNLEQAELEGSTIEEAIFCDTVMPDGSICNRDCSFVTEKSCPWFTRY